MFPSFPSAQRRAAIFMWVPLLILGAHASVQAGEQSSGPGPEFRRLTASVGLDYSSGDYDDDAATSLLYVPMSLRYEFGSWSAKVTVPYLRIDRPRPRGRRSATRRSGNMRSGLGDIVTSLSYTLDLGWDAAPRVRLKAKVKLPTADEGDGLGSGTTDYTGEVSLFKTYGAFTPYLSLGYRMPGDTPGIDRENRMLGSFGVGYRLSNRARLGLAYDFREASRPGREDARELVPYASFRVNRTTKIGTYLVVGFSEASPDYALGLRLSYAFD